MNTASSHARVHELCYRHAGRTTDDRLRRRKGLEDMDTSPSSNGHLGDGVPQPSGNALLAAIWRIDGLQMCHPNPAQIKQCISASDLKGREASGR